ncbi:MAG: DNA polymerase III subunit gamma/tau [Cyclobacteriaceae bacterium]
MGKEKSLVKKTPSIPNSIGEVRQQLENKPVMPNFPVGKKKDVSQEVSMEIKIPPLDKKSVNLALDEVLQVFKEDHKSMETAVIKQPFEIRENNIVFFLQGGLQEDIFVKMKPELTGIFRRKLQHPELDVTFEIKKEAEDPSKNLYTSSEKLEFLLKKSPALKELKKRFGLETDF